ncbi:epoxyqueuosine reductase [Desulfosediminicola sp.]|uniref:epoxyqueuosine reductase n=1 Tax=Desulfosediminicola sp. TaxID=2886825 RepID=UPI003AF30D1A
MARKNSFCHTGGLAGLITDKAKACGADLAGIVNLEELRRSPSYTIIPRIGYFGDGDKENQRTIVRDTVQWPEAAKSAIVIAIHHPAEKPELDWWVSKNGSVGNTEGNKLLIRAMSSLVEWLETEQHIDCFKVPYNVERGGVFMKDAAVLGGLGCIGKNNMLITPEYGPRVRLRVILSAEDIPSTGGLDFDPCGDCSMPCRKACPQGAFSQQVYFSDTLGVESLPGRSGVYDRIRCNLQMVENESKAELAGADEHANGAMELVQYCRKCELICPVGSA